MIRSIEDVVKNDLCVSCGACAAFGGEAVVKMCEDKKKGIFLPVSEQSNSNWGKGKEFTVCPGKGYPIRSIGEQLFPNAANNSVDLGRWDSAYVTRSLTDAILENAASGGVMTAIAEYLLGENIVQGVVVTRMRYSDSGPRPESFIAINLDELKEAQGSKYCPVPIFGDVNQVENFSGKLLFIGTPCQIAALRLAQHNDHLLVDKIPFTIGNFCGGYRDLREMDKIISRSGIDKSKVNFLRYRGGGQPGTMMIRSGVKQKILDYPGYARMTGVIKYQRCRLCVDATAELADFSCGDAWIPECLSSGKTWSIVLARSPIAKSLLLTLRDRGSIELLDVSEEDIKLSQKGNLTSKKNRQASRIKLYRLLGIKTPEFDGGYYHGNEGLMFEIKVHVSHTFFYFLEKVGLYKLFSQLIGRYPKG